MAKSLVKQLDDLIKLFSRLRTRSTHDDLSDLSEGDVVTFNTRALAAVLRVAGESSPYYEQARRTLATRAYPGFWAKNLVGVVQALRDDIAAGYLETHAQLVRGDLFSDFLEMADHLLSESYKDAAAVIAGSSLEAHRRQLCTNVGIPTAVPSNAKSVPKNADVINSDLAKAGVYGKNEQKRITAWLGIRNSAAHGNYGEYTNDQVDHMIDGIRQFMVRHPA